MDHHDGELSGDYLLSNAVTYYELKADVRSKPLLLATPWSRTAGSSVLDGSTWNSFNVNEVRGY